MYNRNAKKKERTNLMYTKENKSREKQKKKRRVKFRTRHENITKK